MKNVRNRQLNKGFTLAELLIVIAIIGVLTAIALPAFIKNLERSRESADLSNVRAAYAEIACAAVEDRRSASDLYTTVNGEGVYKLAVPLTQKKDGWSSAYSKLVVAGITSNDPQWQGSPAVGGECWVLYNIQRDLFTLNWSGVAGNVSFLAATAPYQYEELMTLHEVDKTERRAADKQTLTAIGEELLAQGLTLTEFKAKYSILSQGGAVRVADYYQLKTGSFEDVYSSGGFKLTTTDAFMTDILDGIGYVHGAASDSSSGRPHGLTATTTTYQNSLFFSDELATNQYADAEGNAYDIGATMRAIIIDSIVTDENDKITSFRIYTKAMDEQANMGEADKRYFRVTISRPPRNAKRRGQHLLPALPYYIRRYLPSPAVFRRGRRGSPVFARPPVSPVGADAHIGPPLRLPPHPVPPVIPRRRSRRGRRDPSLPSVLPSKKPPFGGFLLGDLSLIFPSRTRRPAPSSAGPTG